MAFEIFSLFSCGLNQNTIHIKARVGMKTKYAGMCGINSGDL